MIFWLVRNSMDVFVTNVTRSSRGYDLIRWTHIICRHPCDGIVTGGRKAS